MKRSLVLAVLVAAPAALQAQVNPILEALPPNTAVDLGPVELPDIPGDSTGGCSQALGKTAYSRFTYDPIDHLMLLFGGGHATTSRDDVAAFDFGTLRWESAYTPTPLGDMAGANLDTTHGRWISSNHPTARHTYDALVWAESTGELVLLSSNDGQPTCNYPNTPAYHGTTIAQYDPLARTWTFTEHPTLGLACAAEYDPLSGRIVAFGAQGYEAKGLWTYDPETRDLKRHADTPNFRSYADNLVYFPPNDRMYYFSRGDPIRVFEIELDREDFSRTRITEIATTGAPAAPAGDADDTGFAYDAADQIIGGGISDGVFHAFDPIARAWTSVVMNTEPAGGTIGTQADHALDYDVRDGVFVFVTTYGSGGHTWAYRYGPGEPPSLPPPREAGGGTGQGGTTSQAAGSGGCQTGAGPSLLPWLALMALRPTRARRRP
jgi:hypothetical protein